MKNNLFLVMAGLFVGFLPKPSLADTIKEVRMSVECTGTLSGATAETTFDCESTSSTSPLELQAKSNLVLTAKCYTYSQDTSEGHHKESTANISYYWIDEHDIEFEGAVHESTASDNSSSTFSVVLPNENVEGSIMPTCSDSTMNSASADCEDGQCNQDYQRVYLSVKKGTLLLRRPDIFSPSIPLGTVGDPSEETPETDTTDTDIGTDTTVLDVGTDTTPTVDTGLDEPLDEEGGSGASSFGEESEDTGSEGSDADSGDGGQGCSCFISSGNPVQAGLDALPFILLLLLPMVFRRKRPMARANG